ncbi:hypothetical protein M501DRAFT_987471 [Patellaria atrata CBS 101060]|uniref:Methyltransferase type 11 domain-containing protein n=1 Tax=Patellaria atrata CBS 101060 TaxID=1346257 RepID=A0A9P4S4Z0_9PEZI|nr:hypothetical protein M501DRAFT_987471 [Patellaria atrata CBS 101060]
MDTYILPATTYAPNLPATTYTAPSQVRRRTLNTIMEDPSQSTVGYFSPRFANNSAMLSPTYTDDFPTPRASELNSRRLSSPVSVTSPGWRRMSRESEYDSLYDLSDNETEIEVPLKCSNSVKRTSNDIRHQRYPSIVIPSPTAWPTIQKLQKSAVSPLPPTSPPHIMSPRVLSLLASRNLQVPATSATPSLDGSMTSEELDRHSCPSTPDLHAANVGEDDWVPPVQLSSEAMETLNNISSEEQTLENTQTMEIPEMSEMRQVEPSSRPRPISTINTSIRQEDLDELDPISALSVPSPGGFFSSLDSTSRGAWSMPSEEVGPNTSTAENFYGVPWDRDSGTFEHIVEMPESVLSDGPPTAMRTIFSPMEAESEIAEIGQPKGKFEYNEDYEEELLSTAAANLDRTSMWLSAQDSYLSALRETNPLNDLDSTSPVISNRESSIEDTNSSPSKKSVRFTLELQASSPVSSLGEEVEDDGPKDDTFAEGFEYLLDRSQKQDAFIHRLERLEATHLERRYFPDTHIKRLLGKFELSEKVQVTTSRPVSSFYPTDPTEQKEMIARAQKERQALEQLKPVTWVLEATRMLNGGKLLSRPATRLVSRRKGAMVLDLGGQGACDWAWQVAIENEKATVITATTGKKQPSDIQPPSNHREIKVPNMWTLPFPNAHFDVISARSLYAFLKTDKPAGKTIDEYDLCLRECMRCLKPGGILEYALIDSEIVQAGYNASALSVEFGFNLKTRGYDANPTKSFIPRLRRAGFGDVKRAWMVLPAGQTAAKWTDNRESIAPEKTISVDGEVKSVEVGTTADAAGLTGLVGSWAWEKWMLKLQLEMGKDEDKLLEGVVPALEESAKKGAGWRYLNGWAQKPY